MPYLSSNKKRKLLVLAKQNYPTGNDYYSRKILYKRIPVLKNKKKDIESAFTIDSFQGGFNSNQLTKQQRDIGTNLYSNMNSHLNKEMVSLINERNTYSQFYNWNYPIRRSWKDSSFSGKVNSDKTLKELVQQIWGKTKLIYNSPLSFSLKYVQLKELILSSKESLLLKGYFQDIFQEIFLEISIFIEDTKDFKNEAISSETYKDIPSKGSFFTRVFYIFWQFYKTFNKYKNKNKNLHEEGKSGDLTAANNYINRKYNTRLIRNIKKRFDNLNPVLLPVISMPKFQGESDNFFKKLAVSPEATLIKSLKFNVIPLALSQLIANETSWEIDFNVNSNSIIKSSQSSSSKRQSSDVIERFFSLGIYSGTPLKNRNYILVDDNITLGGSIKDLQEYIEKNGGRVVGVITLDRSIKSGYNPNIRPKENQIERIKSKKWYLEYCFTDILGYEDGVGSLTAQEIAALNRWVSFNPFKKNELETRCLESLSNLLIVNENYISIMRKKIIPNIMKKGE